MELEVKVLRALWERGIGVGLKVTIAIIIAIGGGNNEGEAWLFRAVVSAAGFVHAFVIVPPKCTSAMFLQNLVRDEPAGELGKYRKFFS